jgi:AraC family transcriptional regulator of adaptative response/methylated-DNA-[protein]-cysteine methyltransferase
VTLTPRDTGWVATKARQSGLRGELIRYGFGRTSITALLAALSDKGVVAVMIREHPDDEAFVAALRARFPHAELRRDSAGTREVVEEVVGFVESVRSDIALTLDIRGTAFQRRVWAAVLKIPFGQTRTFAEIARQVASPRAVRAIGNACAQNPLEFAIPCHRVLRSDGCYSGGSSWGNWRQLTVVQREAEWTAGRRWAGHNPGLRRTCNGTLD